MIKNLISGLRFTFRHFTSDTVLKVVQSTFPYTDVFYRAKQLTLRVAIALLLSGFLIFVRLPVLAVMALLLALYFAYAVGACLNAPTRLRDHYTFFNKLLEFRDQAWYDLTSQNPNLDVEQARQTLGQFHFQRGKSQVPYRHLEDALQIFAVNEDKKPCYETRYSDIFMFTDLFDIN